MKQCQCFYSDFLPSLHTHVQVLMTKIYINRTNMCSYYIGDIYVLKSISIRIGHVEGRKLYVQSTHGFFFF